MANEFKVKNGLIVIGDLTTSGTITINGALAATQSWVTSQAYLTSASLSGYATQSYVTSAIAALVNSAPAALDTLNELAAALGNDASFSTTITNSIASKQAQLNGTGFVKVSGTTVSYDNSTYLTSYTETDTLATVTSRGNSTTDRINVRGIGNQGGGNIMMGNVGEGTSKWSYLTGTHYNATSQPQGFALIGGLSTSAYNAVVIGGNIYESNPATEIQFWTHSATTHTAGGTQRGIINSVGNWGIGTTSPTEKLQVSGNAYIAGVGSALYFDTDGTSKSITQYVTNLYEFHVLNSRGNSARFILGNAFISLGTGSTPQLYINTTSGNVGIGTITPNSKLDVRGAIESTDTTSRMVLSYNSNGGVVGTLSNSNVIFYSNTAERMRLTAGGNFLIGTTTDSGYKLSVNGTVYIGGVATLNSDANIAGNVATPQITARKYYQQTNGVPTSNLGQPTITEMALFDEQFNNKTAFYNNTSLTFWTSSDGVNFTEYTGFSTTAKKRFLGGDTDSGIFIPNLATRFRVELENTQGYVFLNALYMYWSSNSHSTQVHIWKQRCSDGVWYQHTNSTTTVGAWPGHLYLPFDGIPFLPLPSTSTGHYNRIRIEFIPTWSGDPTYGSQPIYLSRMQIWGGYPAGKRNIYSTDEDRNVTFPNNLSVTGALSSTGNLSVISGSQAFPATSGTTQLGNFARFQNSGTNLTLDIGGNGGNGNWIQSTNSANLAINYALLLNPNGGNVGIGTTSPSAKLDVIGTGVFGSMTASRGNYSNGLSLQNSAGQATSLFLWQSGVASAHIGFPASSSTLYIVNSYSTGLITESNYIVLTSTGNVGIGVTNPSSKLQVAGDIRIQNETGLITDYGPLVGRYNTSQVYVGTGGSYSIVKIGRDDGGALNVLSGGNVGIGTTSPNTKLHVVGNAWINRPSNKVDNNTATEFGSRVEFNNAFATSQSGYMIFRYPTYNNFLIAGDYDGNVGGAIPNIQFGKQSTVYMHINSSNGNVGIGTTTPTRKLEVQGDFYINGTNGAFTTESSQSNLYLLNLTRTTTSLITAGNVGLGTSSPAGRLSWLDTYYNTFFRSGSPYYGTALIMSGDAGTDQKSWRTWSRFSGSSGVDMSWEVSTNSVAYGSDPTGLTYSEKMRLTSDGSLGIGTTSPTQRLHIVGVGAINDGITIQNTSASGNSQLRFLNTSGDQRSAITYINSSDATYHWTASGGNLLNLVSANVGIGTTSPSAKLHVNGTFISNALWTDGTSIGYWGAYPTAYGGLTWDTGQATVFATSGNKLYLASNGSSPDMTIDTNSYVGIGSTSPSFKTTISADITKSGDINPGTAQLSLEGSTTPGKRMILGYDINSNGFGFIKSGNYGVTWTPLALQPDGGNVGIGTVSPSTKLDVSGVITATGGNSTNWNTAYGWGNHSGLYAPLVHTHSAADITSGTLASARLSGSYAIDISGASSTSNTLTREDNRTISPSELAAGQLKFGFTSWANNNTSPYADFLHLRSYTDASGGSDNLVMFKKSGLGMRIWQQAWGNSGAYSSYVDVWTTGDFTSTSVSNWNTAYGWGNHASAGYATTSYVTTQINNLIAGAPGALDTLDELAAALGDDSNFATTVTNSIAGKVSKSGDTMTGSLTIQNGPSASWDYMTLEHTGPQARINLGNAENGFLIAHEGTTTVTFATNGNLTITGALIETSSIKVKENVETSEGNLEKVVNLRPVTYNKIGSETKELGLIAEEVAEVYPEFVQYDENGDPIGVHYSRLTAALIGAVKELTNQVQELNKKING